MSADILPLHPEQSGERPLVLRLSPRAAARLRAKAKDCHIEPHELARLLLEQILKPGSKAS